jgi:hypothetical protein
MYPRHEACLESEVTVRNPRTSGFVSVVSIVLTALVSLSAVAQAPTPAPAPAVMSREQLQKLLDESGTVVNNLVTARNQEVPKELADRKDKRGQTIKADLQDNVMRPEVETRLKSLRESAAKDLAAGDLPGVQVTLINLRRELTTEIERYQGIVAYWRDIGTRGLPTGVADESVLRAHRVEPAFQKELTDLGSQLGKQIASRDFHTAMATTWPRYQDVLKRKDTEESRRIMASIDTGGFTDLHSANPTRACEPASSTSEDDVPRTRSDFPSPADFFPAKLKQLGITQGTLDVFVVVSAKGCAERAVLMKPSEYPEFDQAGLDMAVEGKYLPASKEGAAMRGGMFLRIRFDSGT